MSLPRNSSADQGFTLLELVVVLGTITLIAGMVVPYLSVSLRLAATERTQDQMNDLERALNEYGQDLSKYPSSLDELLTNGDAEAGWRGPYAMHRFSATASGHSGDLRKDGWSQDFLYTTSDATHARLRSLGDDRVAGNDDDLVKDLDLSPILRRDTKRREEALDAAIARWNADQLPTDPLPGDFPSLRKTLIAGGYLGDDAWHATDSWGNPFVVVGKPPSRVESTNGGV